MGFQKAESHRRGNEYSRSKKAGRKQKKLPQVQKLYQTCKEVFANCGPGIVPEPADIERLKAVLDGMTAADVGLGPNMPYFWMKDVQGSPKITYLHLYSCEKFSIGIFCLPKSAVIPLHNHPGMTVFSKLLFGDLHIKSYDWVVDGSADTAATLSPSDSAKPGGARLAKVKLNFNYTAPHTSILYPADGGNMHCFRAVKPCAVLDVLGPPYSDPEGRHCTYFWDFPFADFPGDGLSVAEEEREEYAWLQEREEPEDLRMVGALYSGPKIVE